MTNLKMTDIEALIANGDLMEAMKQYSLATQTDLVTARNAVEHYKNLGNWPTN